MFSHKDVYITNVYYTRLIAHGEKSKQVTSKIRGIAWEIFDSAFFTHSDHASLCYKVNRQETVLCEKASYFKVNIEWVSKNYKWNNVLLVLRDKNCILERGKNWIHESDELKPPN